jgi:hypothetical protein
LLYFTLYIFQGASFLRFLFKEICGGDKENRTPDPLLARQVLSQLSYTPTNLSFMGLEN